MNWDMAGAIGELISAVGVILSLFYLAVQIKGNTIASQAASRLDITRDYRAVNTQKLEPRNALAWHVGLWRYPNVDEDDRLLFSYLMSSEALFFQGTYALRETDQLDKGTYVAYLMWFAGIVKTPGGSSWWNDVGKAIFEPRAVMAVDQAIANEEAPDILTLDAYREPLSE